MIDKIKDLTAAHGKLLYVTEFGSILYGTNSATSDIDYKGIFLPYEHDMLLGKPAKNIQYTTGNQHSRNTEDDIDISLWSLQYFMELIGKGDTHAIDLLFSMYSSHNNKYFDKDFMDCMMLYDPKELIDIKNSKSYVSYAYSQAKKYGLKGSRLAKLKEVIEFLESKNFAMETKIGTVFEDIINKFYDQSLCFIKEDLLYLLGKGFNPHVKMKEVLERLHADYDKYGERAKEAEQNKNIDWKAVSHAVRCLLQMIELIDTGKISYPLKDADFIKEIKYGKRTWQEIEQIIIDLLRQVDEKIVNVPANKTYNDCHKDIILSQYHVNNEMSPNMM